MANRQPISGLASLKRDWSSSQMFSSQSSERESIFWPPSPEQPAPVKIQKTIVDHERRLKNIMNGLEARVVSGEAVLSATSSTSVLSKRPSSESSGERAAKRRQLPESWKNDDTSSTSKASSGVSRTTVLSSTFKPAPTVRAKPAAVFLSGEQTQILKLVEQGESLFYTGSAGTGKSVLLREIIKKLRKKFVKSVDAVAITASTGIAACNIGGVTIHSFAGIGLGVESAEHLVQKIKKNKKAITRWLRTHVLIIDEVSMVEGDLFDKLARIGSLIRKRPEPFGGIQVVVTGDFFQLPPVVKNGSACKFAFEAQMWNETIKRTFNLTKVFRQTDQEFIDMLNEMRFGRLSNKSIAKFKSLSRNIEYEDGLGPTELFPRREDVDRSNGTRMSHLQTEEVYYPTVDGGSLPPEQRARLLANCMAPAKLFLKIDSQVMLIKNMEDTLVNGSMGRVVRFQDPSLMVGEDGEVVEDKQKKKAIASVGPGLKNKVWPVVEFTTGNIRREVMITPETWKSELPNGEVQASRTQLPLILAWAMSIHKSQGQTLERVKVDLGKVFEKGQAYVALSRATSLDGLQILNFDASKVQAHPKVAKWSATLETISQ